MHKDNKKSKMPKLNSIPPTSIVQETHSKDNTELNFLQNPTITPKHIYEYHQSETNRSNSQYMNHEKSLLIYQEKINKLETELELA